MTQIGSLYTLAVSTHIPIEAFKLIHIMVVQLNANFLLLYNNIYLMFEYYIEEEKNLLAQCMKKTSTLA